VVLGEAILQAWHHDSMRPQAVGGF
jgi:hypothetical protein